jgi:hypothetical protein
LHMALLLGLHPMLNLECGWNTERTWLKCELVVRKSVMLWIKSKNTVLSTCTIVHFVNSVCSWVEWTLLGLSHSTKS